MRIVFFEDRKHWYYRVDDVLSFVLLRTDIYPQYEVKIRHADGGFGYVSVLKEEWERARKLAEA